MWLADARCRDVLPDRVDVRRGSSRSVRRQVYHKTNVEFTGRTRGYILRVSKTVSSGMSAPAMAVGWPARHPGLASCSRHGPDARNDGAAPTKQETALDTTIASVDGGGNALKGPVDACQGGSE